MTVQAKLFETFLQWEKCGRGVNFAHDLVALESRCPRYPGHKFTSETDSGSRPTMFSRLFQNVEKSLRGESSVAKEDEVEPTPFEAAQSLCCEITALIPVELTISAEAMTHFFKNVAQLQHHMGMEWLVWQGQMRFQLVCHEDDLAFLHLQLREHFPQIHWRLSQDALLDTWQRSESTYSKVLEFGLGRPFVLPLADTGKHDFFVGLCAGFAGMEHDEIAAYQVLFAPAQDDWSEEILRSVTNDRHTKSLVAWDDGQTQKRAREKVSAPLYAVNLRMAVGADNRKRVWEILKHMTAPLHAFSDPEGNVFTPLSHPDYDKDTHLQDFLLRQTRRHGMILNERELLGLAHFPSAQVRNSKVLRLSENTRRGQFDFDDESVNLGFNVHEEEEVEVWQSTRQRVRHTHIIGASGSGKTNLLVHMILQDVWSGNGLAVFDPHGDLVDYIMSQIPDDRIDDVILFDPSDERYVIPFNFLHAHGDFEKSLLASDLVAVFRSLSTSWGDQMNSVFNNAVAAFLESSQGGTLADLRRFLLDATWRDQFLESVRDPEIHFYWKKAFPQLGGNKSIGPILTRLDTFLAPKTIRYMLSHGDNRLDFSAIMDGRKIFLAKLSQGLIGSENSRLLGSLLFAKLQQMAMSRQRMSAEDREPFFVYADEFQNFICPSMTEILSGARKYGMGLILAHQELRQLERDREVASSVLSNCFSRVVFRVSDGDARTLSEGFRHFGAKDFQSLVIGEAICRLGAADNDFNLQVPLVEADEEIAADLRGDEVREASRAQYAVPISEVEELLAQRYVELQSSHRKSTKTPVAKTESQPQAVIEKTIVNESATDVVTTVVDDAGSETVNNAVDQTVTKATEITQSAQEQPPLETPVPNPSGMGWGGIDHKLLVSLIHDQGLEAGYKVTKEFSVTAGSVDVVLEKRSHRIAVEVGMQTTTAHEIANLKKCLDEGFDFVVSLSPHENILRNIRKRAETEFSSDGRLRFFSPEEFSAWLAELKVAGQVEDPPAPGAREAQTKSGRRYRVKGVEMTDSEAKKFDQEQTRDIADILSKIVPQAPEQS